MQTILHTKLFQRDKTPHKTGRKCGGLSVKRKKKKNDVHRERVSCFFNEKPKVCNNITVFLFIYRQNRRPLCLSKLFRVNLVSIISHVFSLNTRGCQVIRIFRQIFIRSLEADQFWSRFRLPRVSQFSKDISALTASKVYPPSTPTRETNADDACRWILTSRQGCFYIFKLPIENDE